MTPKDINQVVANSLGVVIVIAILVWPVFGTTIAFSVLFGGVFSALNLWAIKSLIVEAMGPCRSIRLFILIAVKAPVFYGLGAYILLTMKVAMFPALGAFQVPFIFAVLESLKGNEKPEEVESAVETKVEVD